MFFFFFFVEIMLFFLQTLPHFLCAGAISSVSFHMFGPNRVLYNHFFNKFSRGGVTQYVTSHRNNKEIAGCAVPLESAQSYLQNLRIFFGCHGFLFSWLFSRFFCTCMVVFVTLVDLMVLMHFQLFMILVCLVSLMDG